MAEKTDEEIIKEVGLETTNGSDELEETLEPIDEDNKKTVIENEDRDDIDPSAIVDSKDEEDNDIPVQKKQPKIIKILIGVAIALVLLISTGAGLYFTGFFDPEPVMEEKPMMKKAEKKVMPEIEFDAKELNKNRLNKKLTALTKHEIMNKEELEEEEKRLQEEERKKKEAEEKALAEKKRKEQERLNAQFKKIEDEKKLLQEHQKAIKEEQKRFLEMQEEAARLLEEKRIQLLQEIENKKNSTPMASMEEKTEQEMMQEEEKMQETNEDMMMQEEEKMQEPIENKAMSFLSFINVATIKGDLYKSFLDEVLRFDKNPSLCRDLKNRIEIYFGPYDSKKERAKVLKNLNDNGFKESYLVDFTKEEYDKRCKY